MPTLETESESESSEKPKAGLGLGANLEQCFQSSLVFLGILKMAGGTIFSTGMECFNTHLGVSRGMQTPVFGIIYYIYSCRRSLKRVLLFMASFVSLTTDSVDVILHSLSMA